MSTPTVDAAVMNDHADAEDISKDEIRTDKQIFLIRHAESQNNVAKRDASSAWRKIRHFTAFPTQQEWYSTSTLLFVPMNTDLSLEGEDMVHELKSRLETDNFIGHNNVQLIVHSHLIRAKRTCEGIFCTTDGSGPVPIIQHDMIFERNISEHIHLADMAQRTRAFTDWLLEREERTIVVVGHSAFFRDLLGTECKMDNCEVRSVWLSADGTFHSAEVVVQGGAALLQHP